jgi:hypothetical protein
MNGCCKICMCSARLDADVRLLSGTSVASQSSHTRPARSARLSNDDRGALFRNPVRLAELTHRPCCCCEQEYEDLMRAFLQLSDPMCRALVNAVAPLVAESFPDAADLLFGLVHGSHGPQTPPAVHVAGAESWGLRKRRRVALMAGMTSSRLGSV